MKEKIIILGCSGFIGQALLEYFSDKKYQIVGTYRNNYCSNSNSNNSNNCNNNNCKGDKSDGNYSNNSNKLSSKEDATIEKLDITVPGKLTALLKRIRPTVIANTIAIGDVNECEKNKTACSRINIGPTEEIAEYCRSNPNVRYIFFSSDHVFDGKTQKPYCETDEKCPVNFYGQTKLQCEQLIISAIPNYAIIRPCFVFGPPKPHHHPNLFSMIYSALQQNSEFKAYTDKIRSPCYVKELPLVMEEIIRKHKKGVFHAGSAPITVHEFGLAIAKFFHFNEKLVAGMPSNQNEFPLRPANCALDNSHTEKELGIKFRALQETFMEIKMDIKKELTKEGSSC